MVRVGGCDRCGSSLHEESQCTQIRPQRPLPELTDDERAATQRRLADAIRGWNGRDIREALAAIGESPNRSLAASLTLAALCSDDALWDAAAQVRQCVVLERK